MKTAIIVLSVLSVIAPVSAADFPPDPQDEALMNACFELSLHSSSSAALIRDYKSALRDAERDKSLAKTSEVIASSAAYKSMLQEGIELYTLRKTEAEHLYNVLSCDKHQGRTAWAFGIIKGATRRAESETK